MPNGTLLLSLTTQTLCSPLHQHPKQPVRIGRYLNLLGSKRFPDPKYCICIIMWWNCSWSFILQKICNSSYSTWKLHHHTCHSVLYHPEKSTSVHFATKSVVNYAAFPFLLINADHQRFDLNLLWYHQSLIYFATVVLQKMLNIHDSYKGKRRNYAQASSRLNIISYE